MKEQYITHRDANGNRYTLEVDHSAKTYKADYNPFRVFDWLEVSAVIGKRERARKIKALESAGYTRIY